MGVSEIETINYTLVMLGLDLLQNQDECVEFQGNVNTEVALTVNREIPMREILISKDRIKIITRIAESGDIPRTEIQMEYPASKEGLDRFAEVAGFSISCSKSPGQLRALGYNTILVYDQDSSPSAHEYLAKLFKPSIHPQWNLHGGSCKLEFREPDQAEGRRWNITLEPRQNNLATAKVFANLHLHIDTSELPIKEEIKSSMERAWNEVCEFIHLLENKE